MSDDKRKMLAWEIAHTTAANRKEAETYAEAAQRANLTPKEAWQLIPQGNVKEGLELIHALKTQKII